MELFRRAGVDYPPRQLYLRAFKAEGQLELWAGGRDEPLQLITSYEICASSGVLGPKRRQGDEQVPEGFYEVTRFRRHTRFFRSLRISYPNRADRLKGSTGGAILIHGKCVTIGCIPLTDPPMGELFEIAIDVRKRSKGKIIVHIFPRRMDLQGMKALGQAAGRNRGLLRFWRSLQPAYQGFEETRRIPRFKVSARGDYLVLSARQ